MTTIAKTIVRQGVAEVVAAAKAEEHLNFIDEFGYTPLIETAIVNDIAKMRVILQHGAKINEADLTGNTALHWACDNTNIEMVRFLLEQGADPNAYNYASLPVLAKPLLREQHELVAILENAGASVAMARDFINAKLIGHRFELRGSIDIVDHNDLFAEVDLEGFFLEFTLDLIHYSLNEYRHNFAARHMRPLFRKLRIISKTLLRSRRLLKYQNYLLDYQDYRTEIDPILNHDPLIIPIAQEGHAITLVKYGNFLAVCDRMQRKDRALDEIPIYYINRLQRFSNDLICELIYSRQMLDVFHKVLPKLLGLREIMKVQVRSQISGNCTWANVEASVPILYLLFSLEGSSNLPLERHFAMSLFYDWREWDKDRALTVAINRFQSADSKRKAMIAAMLAAILFQRCSADEPKDIERAMKIMPVLKTRGYEYLLENYLEVFCYRRTTTAGENLRKLIQRFEAYHF